MTASSNVRPIITSKRLAPVTEDLSANGQIIATDADHDALTYAVKAGAGPAKGNVTFGANGAFVYTPTANANGADSFTVTVSDGHNAAVDALFNFNIAAVNDAPTAVADTGFTVVEEHALKISAASLLQNDKDIDGDSLSITSVFGAQGGTVSRALDGTITFKARDDYKGPASFKYTISDGHGGTSTASVSLTVTREKHEKHTINGTSHHDVLTSTHADDVMTGKAGSDTFVFRPANGHDQINDFQTGGFLTPKDILDLRGNGFTSATDLFNHIHQTAAGAELTFNDGGTVLLKGINEHALGIDHFRLF